MVDVLGILVLLLLMLRLFPERLVMYLKISMGCTLSLKGSLFYFKDLVLNKDLFGILGPYLYFRAEMPAGADNLHLSRYLRFFSFT